MELATATILLINALLGLATLIQGVRTHRTFNSKMDAMLELTRRSAFAAGEKAEANKLKRSQS